jgi:hypothetical protein
VEEQQFWKMLAFLLEGRHLSFPIIRIEEIGVKDILVSR